MTGYDPHLRTPSGKPRARAFGIPFDGAPGTFNAITDVSGVSVGYATLISGDGPLRVGTGPVRTGVTAILPRPLGELATPVFAGVFSQNGNGELTGSHIIEETGAFNLPVTITNTPFLRRYARRHAALDEPSAAGGTRQRLGPAGGGRDL